jgi:hypothetical protein
MEYEEIERMENKEMENGERERIGNIIDDIQEIMIYRMLYDPNHKSKYDDMTIQDFRILLDEKTQIVLDNMNDMEIERAIEKALDD